jgi:hypothetical protein
METKSLNNLSAILLRIAFLICANWFILFHVFPGAQSYRQRKANYNNASKPLLAFEQVIAPDLRVLSSGSYIIDRAESKRVRFLASQTVPFKPGQGYGWAVRVQTSRKTLRVREELILPAPAPHWLVKEGTRISQGGRIATTTWNAEPKNGVIANFWGLAKGDPSGRYEVRVTLDGTPINTFMFSMK